MSRVRVCNKPPPSRVWGEDKGIGGDGGGKDVLTWEKACIMSGGVLDRVMSGYEAEKYKTMNEWCE